MKLAPMRFCGYTWHHNPKNIEISNGRRVVTMKFASTDDLPQSFAKQPLVIQGVGELYGNDSLEQYKRLSEVFSMGENGILCLPKMRPIRAIFEKLELVAGDVPDVITYRFRFVSSKDNVLSNACDNVYTAQGNESLWDVSAQFDIQLETLVKLNPDIMFINCLEKGKQVRLC